MEEHDEIRVFVVDEAGNELARYPCVDYPGELHDRQAIRLNLDGRGRWYRVLGVRPGENGRGRFVEMMEVMRCPFCGGPLLDKDGYAGLKPEERAVVCRHCHERVVLEEVSLPGGPRSFRISSVQDRPPRR